MFIFYADKNKLTVRKREAVTSGSVNAYRVRFEFSPEWDGLERTAVFKAGPEERSVLLDDTNTCGIPWEVLVKPGVRLLAGVYGTKGGEIVLPTVWESLGVILEGVSVPEAESRPPTPDIWQQELARKGDTLAYDGLNLTLKSGDRVLSAVEITGGGSEGIVYRFGHGLKQHGLDVSVDLVNDFSGDNTLPMSAAGVQTVVGNIEILLETI